MISDIFKRLNYLEKSVFSNRCVESQMTRTVVEHPERIFFTFSTSPPGTQTSLELALEVLIHCVVKALP